MTERSAARGGSTTALRFSRVRYQGAEVSGLGAVLRQEASSTENEGPTFARRRGRVGKSRFFPALRGKAEATESKVSLLSSLLLKQSITLRQPHVFNRIPRRIQTAPGNPSLAQKELREMLRNEFLAEKRVRGPVSTVCDAAELDRQRLRREAAWEIFHSFEKFKPGRGTKFLATEYLIRFLTLIQLEYDPLTYKILACTCFNLACKVEEVSLPKENMFEFPRDAFALWEMTLLEFLEWEVQIPSIFTFIFLYYFMTNLTDNPVLGQRIVTDTFCLAEQCSVDGRADRFLPSIKGLCCFMMALRQNDVKDWFKALDFLPCPLETVPASVKDCWSILAELSENQYLVAVRPKRADLTELPGDVSDNWQIPAFL